MGQSLDANGRLGPAVEVGSGSEALLVGHESTGVPEFPAGWASDRDTIRRIFEAVDAVVRRLRPRIDTAGESDPLTEDLLISAARDLEESRWMWQAQSIGYDEAPAS